MAAWEHRPCGNVLQSGKNPPVTCDHCAGLMFRVMKGKQQGWLLLNAVEGEKRMKGTKMRRVAGYIGKKKTQREIGAKRARVYKRDGYACVECGATKHLTLDHWIPRSRGGWNGEDNLVTMCADCNTRKGNSYPSEPIESVLRS